MYAIRSYYGAIDLLERGLRGIRDVVRSALATYRPDREPRHLQAADIDDIPSLARSEARSRQVDLEWRNVLPRAGRRWTKI